MVFTRRLILLVLVTAVCTGVAWAAQQEDPQRGIQKEFKGAIPDWRAPLFWSRAAQAASSEEDSHSKAAVPTPPLPFVGITPCRIADTRDASFPAGYGPPFLPASTPRDFMMTGRCGIPASAEGVSLNITVTNTLGPGFILIHPQGGAQPLVSTLNYVAGQTVANAAVVALGTGGGITVTAGVSGTDLIIDTNGYYGGGLLQPRVEPHPTSPNLIGGFSGNSVTPGAAGATIAGGGTAMFTNRVTDEFGTVGGGAFNRAGDDAGITGDRTFATVGGGYGNAASGANATVGGGFTNTASGGNATVGGGDRNTASGGGNTTVGGGSANTASGNSATVGGGFRNLASGIAATVAGGEGNTARGDHSFAGGLGARATHRGSFVWGDSTTDGEAASSAINQFTVRASGGTRFFSNSFQITGVQLAAGGNAWAPVSDRGVKENFERVDGREVLARLAEIPVETWNLKSQDASIRHIGPMAQDFYSAFCVGEDDKHITTTDADGVALAAIQGLYQMVREKDEQIQALKSQARAEQKQIRSLEARLAALEKLAARSAEPRPHE